MCVHQWPIRIYYEDTDSGGVVYHANYLKFIERARTEWLRQLGIEQPQLRSEWGLLFVVHSMNLAFKHPVYFNEHVLVHTQCLSLGHSSLRFLQQLWREKTLLFEANVRVACIDGVLFKPTLIPSAIRAILETPR